MKRVRSAVTIIMIRIIQKKKVKGTSVPSTGEKKILLQVSETRETISRGWEGVTYSTTIIGDRPERQWMNASYTSERWSAMSWLQLQCTVAYALHYNSFTGGGEATPGSVPELFALGFWATTSGSYSLRWSTACTNCSINSTQSFSWSAGVQ